MQIRLTELATRDLEAIETFIASDSPPAALRTVLGVLHAIEGLAELPNLGRAGRVPGTRELVVSGTLIAGIACARRSSGCSVLHGARRWPLTSAASPRAPSPVRLLARTRRYRSRGDPRRPRAPTRRGGGWVPRARPAPEPSPAVPSLVQVPPAPSAPRCLQSRLILPRCGRRGRAYTTSSPGPEGNLKRRGHRVRRE
ncbi:MAG: type II toxin-antitoxin system RelE/ParE family toxin [Proteobacteria bacterium]|nr:type II toxin-antitoxin system RelE/ParE family toxin [Pseudomonadota bacterium]